MSFQGHLVCHTCKLKLSLGKLIRDVGRVLPKLMNIVGEDYLRTLISQDGYFIKFAFNARAAHFFPYTTEHRDASLPGMYYRDDSMGDAIAATIKPAQIDIRLHRAFSPSQVKTILERMERDIGNDGNTQPFDVNYGGKYLTTIRLSTYDIAERSLQADPPLKAIATRKPIDAGDGSADS